MLSALFANADWTGLLFMFSDPFPTNATKVLLYHLKYVTTFCIHLLHILIELRYFPTATRIKLKAVWAICFYQTPKFSIPLLKKI